MIPHPEHIHIEIVNTRPEHVEALARMQRLIYPTLTDDELYTVPKYLKHLEIFPEGQFVALARIDGALIPVASTSTFRTDFDFDHIQHTYMQAVAEGWLTNHDPNGEWLYGADMAVHPDFRGHRIGSRLYIARRELVRRLNLRGEVAGGMLPGYHIYRATLSIQQYILQVHQGKLKDPTLSMQLKNGFRVRGVLYDHITDPRSNNTATLIVRENPYYVPKGKPSAAQMHVRKTSAPMQPAPAARSPRPSQNAAGV